MANSVNTDPTVVIIGAGPAGVRAAERLVDAGIRPIVVDEGRRSGGQIYRRQPENFARPPKDLYGFEAGKASAVHRTFDALEPRIDYRPETLAWHVYEGEVHLARDGRSKAVRYDALVLATGATDRLMPVPGWTKPGTFSLGGAQIALKAQACAIGERCVFMGTGPLLYLVAYQYAKAGAQVEAVLDTSPASGRLKALPYLAARPAMLAKGMYYTGWLAAHRVPVFTGVTPLEIEGGEHVTGVRIDDAGGRERHFECDAVGLGFGLRSETQLADLARCRFAFDPLVRQWLPETDEDGRTTAERVYLAGDGAKILGADSAEITGHLAACAVLRDLGRPVAESEIAGLRAAKGAMERFRKGLETAFPYPVHLAAALPDDTLVCRCEAVTAGTIRHAATDLGAPEVNRAKALVRIGMGRCQGRYCALAGAEVLAAALDAPVESVGRQRGQGPVKPLPIATEPAEVETA